MVIKQESKISVTISGATRHFSRIQSRNQIAKKNNRISDQPGPELEELDIRYIPK